MEAILSEASTSLRDRGPPVPGPFFAFDIATSSFLHREMGVPGDFCSGVVEHEAVHSRGAVNDSRHEVVLVGSPKKAS